MDYIDLGRRVKELRKKQHMTQEALAEKLDISTSFLGHIERGTRVASLETLVKLCTPAFRKIADYSAASIISFFCCQIKGKAGHQQHSSQELPCLAHKGRVSRLTASGRVDAQPVGEVAYKPF